jgi:hypothetical protein
MCADHVDDLVYVRSYRGCAVGLDHLLLTLSSIYWVALRGRRRRVKRV